MDETYTDEVKVILRNHGTDAFGYYKGERIAQLIVTKIEHCVLNIIDELGAESRGGGFGSTGK